ncbi:MAG TPA: F0F1 ATP synthase subunit A [Phycisphaerae bacterium]|nr:F0F1 ATP synthase subunit A [Phycisphaerae bacterium]
MIDGLLAEGSPLEHVVQHSYYATPLPLPAPFDRFSWLSNHIVMQFVAAVVLLLVIPRAIRTRAGEDKVGRFVPRGFGKFIELLCDKFLREYVAQPALGRHTDRFIPYIWSVFFFILTCNLLGLIPLADWTRPVFGGHGVGGTSTGNIWVTGTLAACTLAMILYNGMRISGIAYLKHFFIGPFPINILIALLEVVGLVAKTFALAMRLFANMVAGHVLLAVLLSFIGMSAAALGSGSALLISLPVVVGSVALSWLEVFVAGLQAFIFTFLTTMFIGQAINIPHEQDEHGHQHAEEERTAAAQHA